MTETEENYQRPEPSVIPGTGVKPRHPYWIGAGFAALVLVFAIEPLTPLGFAHGTLYLPAILLVALSLREAPVLLATVLAVLLTAVGAFLSPPGFDMTYVTLNRLVSVGVIVMTALVVRRWLRLHQSRERAHRRLQAAVTERDRQQLLLEIGSEVARLGGWEFDVETNEASWSEHLGTALALPPTLQGSTAEEALQLVPEPYHRDYLAAFGRCIKHGEPVDLEVPIRDNNGNERWTRQVARAVADDNGRVVRLQGASLDITEHRNLEAMLTSHRQMFRQLANALPLTVWTATPDGHVDFINRALSQYLYGEDIDLSEPEWLSAIHEDDRQTAVAKRRQSLKEGAAMQTEYRLRRHDGSYRWFRSVVQPLRDDGGKIVKWSGSLHDIDDIVRLQQRAEELAQTLEAMLESVTDPFFMVDRQARPVYLNSPAREMLAGYQDPAAGLPLWQGLPEESQTNAKYWLAKVLGEGETVEQRYFDERRERWFQVVAYPSPRGAVISFRDISERIALDDRLRQAQRLESVGHLTGGVAHDFNNLLTVIIGNAELLTEALAGQEALQHQAQMIVSAANSGAELTHRLLAFARRQPLKPQPTDVNALIADMDGLLRRTLSADIDIETVLGGGLWRAQVDPGQLESALLNLSLNARDAMSEGGRLTIETANSRLDQVYAESHQEVHRGQYVMVAVSDTGTGIAPGHMDTIFDPFFTTKEKGKGTGLGLSMVYGFVKQSGGHIKVYSEEGQGTTVKMYLPRAIGAEALADGGQKSSVQRGSETVLLAEDDELVRELARTHLQSLGYKVYTAADGPEALRVVEKEGPMIDLLFTDVVMTGGLNGRQLADKAQSLYPHIRVLYTSGYTENAVVHHGRLDPGVSLLSKPYNRAELAREVRAALSGNRDDN